MFPQTAVFLAECMEGATILTPGGEIRYEDRGGALRLVWNVSSCLDWRDATRMMAEAPF